MAHVETWQAENMCRRLVGMNGKGQSENPTVPSATQLHECRSAKEVVELEGDSDEELVAFGANPGVLTWEPEFIIGLPGMPGSIAAADMLVLLNEHIEKANVNGGMSTEEIDGKWGRHLKTLWVVAMGYADKASFNNPRNLDPELEEGLDHTYAVRTNELALLEKRMTEIHKKEARDRRPGGGQETPSTTGQEGGEDETTKGSDKSPETNRNDDLSRSSEGSPLGEVRTPQARGKRSDDPDDSDPSSSESEDWRGSDSEGSGRRGRSHSVRNLEKSLKDMADVLALTFTKANKKEKKKSSVFSSWTDDEQTLLHLLSSDRFRERKLPGLTSFTKKLTADRKITKAVQMIAQESQRLRWAGRPMDSAVAIFLSQGFSNYDILVTPQGLSALTCAPRGHLGPRGDDAREENVQELFGSGKLSQKTLEGFSKVRIHAPKSFHEARDQLSVMVSLLDLITGKDSIASQGYKTGKRFLDDNRDEVEAAVKDDPYFLMKYLFMLDRHFQSFCRLLLEHAVGRDPLAEAEKVLKGYFQMSQRREMGNLEGGGGAPTLSMPSGFKETNPEEKKRGRTPGGGRTTPDLRSPRNDKKKKVEEQEWHSKLPDPEASWKLPEGKTMRDFFPTNESKAGFPKLTHHVNGKQSRICIPYFVLGKCDRGVSCFNSHNKVSDIPAQKKAEITAKIKAAYGPSFRG
jgi:hypothetical protein